ncbi:MAG: ATP-binding protein, partial [Betaproteobacteria bacterium]
MTQKTRNAPPRAAAMLESLRGLGYSTAASLADIVDNSISAGATEVRIEFVWDGAHSRITILDDGRGMDDGELESALRLGDKNPLDARDARDLGRFGMGLKTASFAQCRRLTVASVKDGAQSCLRWDLEELASRPDS